MSKRKIFFKIFDFKSIRYLNFIIRSNTFFYVKNFYIIIISYFCIIPFIKKNLN